MRRLSTTYLVVIVCCMSCYSQSDSQESHKKLKNLGGNIILSQLSLSDEGKLIAGRNNGIASIYSIKDSISFILDIKTKAEFVGATLYYKNKIFVSGDNRLYCFNQSGVFQWSKTFSDRIKSQIKYLDENIYAQVRGEGIYCININDGSSIWKYQSNEGTIGGLQIYENIVLVSDLGSKLLALNAGNGRVIWKKDFKGKMLSNLAVVDNVIALNVCDLQNPELSGITVLDFETRNEIFKASINVNCRYKPLIYHNFLYVGTEDSKILAFDYKRNMKVWECALENDDVLATNLTLSKDDLFFGSINRNVYRVSKSTGEILDFRNFEYGISELLTYKKAVYFLTGNGDFVQY